MKYFFIDTWDLLTESIDGFWDGVLRVLLWIVFLLVVFLILWGVFYCLDSCGTSRHEGKGVVTGRYHHPAYTSTTFVQSGKSTIPITTYHPERWSISISVNNKSDNVTVSESYCNWVSEGDTVNIIYSKGRISKGIYIREIIN